jgi:hypothetical protein
MMKINILAGLAVLFLYILALFNPVIFLICTFIFFSTLRSIYKKPNFKPSKLINWLFATGNSLHIITFTIFGLATNSGANAISAGIFASIFLILSLALLFLGAIFINIQVINTDARQ